MYSTNLTIFLKMPVASLWIEFTTLWKWYVCGKAKGFQTWKFRTHLSWMLRTQLDSHTKSVSEPRWVANLKQITLCPKQKQACEQESRVRAWLPSIEKNVSVIIANQWYSVLVYVKDVPVWQKFAEPSLAPSHSSLSLTFSACNTVFILYCPFTANTELLFSLFRIRIRLYLIYIAGSIQIRPLVNRENCHKNIKEIRKHWYAKTCFLVYGC